MLRPMSWSSHVEAVHLEYFAEIEAIADAKAEIFAGLEADGVAILNRDNPQFSRLSAKARLLRRAHLEFRRSAGAEAKLDSVALDLAGSTVAATILGLRSFPPAASRRHQVRHCGSAASLPLG